MKIYVNFTPPKTIHKFLKKFFSVALNSCLRNVTTYLNEKCTRVQCAANKNRSIQDMYDCINTYYPNTTLETVVSELVKLHPEGYYFFPMYCSVIGRDVMVYYTNKMNALPKIKDDMYNWGRLINELGIKTIKELYEYKG